MKGVAIVKTSVLYLDDEKVLLDIFAEMFRDEYEVRTALTLLEARQALSEHPDIIISDWSMPGTSGIEFLREAMKLSPNSFRILLTGYGQVGDVFAELSAGVVQLFITKPWNDNEMRGALERAAITLRRG
jgi:DNA-binding NtrC family response regulator